MYNEEKIFEALDGIIRPVGQIKLKSQPIL